MRCRCTQCRSVRRGAPQALPSCCIKASRYKIFAGRADLSDPSSRPQPNQLGIKCWVCAGTGLSLLVLGGPAVAVEGRHGRPGFGFCGFVWGLLGVSTGFRSWADTPEAAACDFAGIDLLAPVAETRAGVVDAVPALLVDGLPHTRTSFHFTYHRHHSSRRMMTRALSSWSRLRLTMAMGS